MLFMKLGLTVFLYKNFLQGISHNAFRLRYNKSITDTSTHFVSWKQAWLDPTDN